MASSACSTTRTSPPADLPSVDKTPPIALPSEPELKPVQFGVIGDGCTPENYVGANCKITMSPEAFEDLTNNIGELLRWFNEATFQLRYYREEETLINE